MSTRALASPSLLLRPAVDSRPRAYRFGAPGRVEADDDAERQPSLLDALQDLSDEPTGPPRPHGVRIHGDSAPGALEPAAGLPDPGAWAAVLGLAVGQVLVGARPVGQLDCWLEPGVLADLKYTVRERVRPRQPGRIMADARTTVVRVVSVRVQLPTPVSVEVAIHLRLGTRSSALAARLEAHGRRWVCTELVRPDPVSDPRPARGTA